MDDLVGLINERLNEIDKLLKLSTKNLSVDQTIQLIVDLQRYNDDTQSLIKRLKKLIKNDVSRSNRSTMN